MLADTVSLAPGAGDLQGDVTDQANADAEAELHIFLPCSLLATIRRD